MNLIKTEAYKFSISSFIVSPLASISYLFQLILPKLRLLYWIAFFLSVMLWTVSFGSHRNGVICFVRIVTSSEIPAVSPAYTKKFFHDQERDENRLDVHLNDL